MSEQGIFGERYEARIARAISFVDANPAEHISLEKLASIACLSPFHFHRIFRSLTGEAVREFVERRKLEHAIALANKGKPWKYAASACGFGSPISFTRAFKRVYNVLPSQFDLAGWWHKRGDREDAFKVSSYFLRPAPPLDLEFKVNVMERPSARLAVSRAWSGYLHPERLMGAYNRLRNWAKKAGIDAKDGKIVGASRDDPDLTPLSRCRYDFLIELPDGVDPPTYFSIAERKAGLWAVTPVAGGMDVVDRAWSMLFKSWLPASGLDLRGEPAEEVYLKLPEDIGWTEFDLLCCVPVAHPPK
ncbi:MAG: AraC family transcriptional regulator [Sphingorhabdus sp.]